MRKIVKGDDVIVIAGRNKGERGTVRKYIVETDRVVIEGVNLVKKHRRQTQGQTRQGGIIEVEAPLHVSNVMLIEPGTEEPTRVGIRRNDDGKNERFAKKSGNTIPSPNA
jgi:large subunit ribosomal protein L24